MAIKPSQVVALVILIAAIVAGRAFSGYPPSLRIDGRNSAIAFTPDGKFLAVSGSVPDGLTLKPDGPIRLVDAETGTVAGALMPLPTMSEGDLRFPREILKAEFSPDGSLLAVLREHRDIRRIDELELFLLDRKTGTVSSLTSLPYNRFQGKGWICRNLFSGDGKSLAWVEQKVGTAFKVVVWDRESSKTRFTLADSRYPAFSPDSRLLATREPSKGHGTGAVPATCTLRDIRTGEAIRTIPLGNVAEGWLPWPSFSPDGRRIALNSRDDSGKPLTEVFDVETGRSLFRGPVWSPQFLAKCGKLVTVEGIDVQLRETTTWKPRTVVPFHLGRHWANNEILPPEPVAIPGSDRIAVFGRTPEFANPKLAWIDRQIQINASGPNRLTLIDGDSGATRAIALFDPLLTRSVWAPDGRGFALESLTGEVEIWELPPGRSWRPSLVFGGIALLGLLLVKSLLGLRRVIGKARALSAPGP